jgi:replicative superfamily II helicase
MIDKKTQLQLMDYLFDEMNSDEKKEFEQKLQNSVELRDKLNELKATQSVIGKYSPEEPEETGFHYPDKSNKRETAKEVRRINYVVLAAAAVLLISLFIGLFSSVQFGETEQGYYLTFGSPPVQVDQTGISEEELNQIIAEIKTENSLMLNSMMEQTQREQNERFNESLTALAEYYEERRNRDLMLFTEGLLQLEESTTTEIDRTNRALNGIIYALSTE